MRRYPLLLLSFLIVFFSGCLGAAPPEDSSATPSLQPPRVFVTTLSPVPSITFSPIPSATFTPTLLPTPTAIPSPMSIMVMRAESYPGSDIHIESTLTPGAAYQCYYASYLSQGLKIFGLLTVPDEPMPAGGWPGGGL